MILGLGNDVIDIRRIERTIELYGDRFLNRIFTEVERKKSDRRRERAASYAKRFAAKEACSKALGTGLSMGVRWREMEVRRARGDRPRLALSGRTAELGEARGVRRLHVSLAHDGGLAVAQVLAEGEGGLP